VSYQFGETVQGSTYNPFLLFIQLFVLWKKDKWIMGNNIITYSLLVLVCIYVFVKNVDYQKK
jgi:hypothetical protein